MWQPEPHWERLRSGMGGSTLGVWRDGPLVVKRVQAPLPGDPEEYARPTHHAYWRRPVEIATSQMVTATVGLRAPSATRVEEDPEGASIWQRQVRAETLPGAFVARALGRFCGADLGTHGWLATHQLEDRLSLVERRGGWHALRRTAIADVADRLWQRRGALLTRLQELPQVPQHGDPVPDNMVGRDGEDVIAVDWATLGRGPIGADLGYWALSVHEDFEALLAAYADGLPRALDPEHAGLAARVTAAYTVLTRADWALRRVGGGLRDPGHAYRHPSVAPHLRELQRRLPQLEQLL